MFEIITMEDERAKEEKLIGLPGITEAQIQDANQGFMVATICRVLYFSLEALRNPDMMGGQCGREIECIDR